jgi:hypothetical protein
MIALGSVLNYVILNLALVLTALPIVTLPLAVGAATKALDKWRREGEDRVVREFFRTLRAQSRMGTIVTSGVPFVAIGVGVEEIRYFAGGNGHIIGQVCLGLGVLGTLVTLVSVGYVLVLSCRYPSARPAEVLQMAVQLGVRNLFFTGPLFLAEMAGAVALCFIDPALIVVGLPVALLNLMRVTADVGIRRERRRSGGI